MRTPRVPRPVSMDPPEESPLSRVHCGHCGEVHPQSFSHCPQTGRPLNTGRALVGRVIADRYRVIGLIGEGGMGAVYVAEHLMIGRKVALKRLHPELVGDDNAVKRFQREARAAAATGHEHIVEVLDLGFGEDGAPFLVMEYLSGRSLAQTLREDGRLEPRRVCHIVGQVLAALVAVHERGIVHRDLKPDNIILTRRRGDPDFVKVVDFGISKMQRDGPEGLTLTRTGVTLGTPFYMSPEQARGVKDLDHRVDLYGAGVIMYECLTGRLPFDGDNYHQLLQAILSGRRPQVRELRPEVPEALALIVERAIAIDRNARFSSARELLLALVPHGAVDPGPAEHAGRPLAPLEDAKTTPVSRAQAAPLLEKATASSAELAPSAERSSWVGPAEPTPLLDRPRASVVGPTPLPERPQRAIPVEAPPPAPARSARQRTPKPRGLAPEPRLPSGGAPRRFVEQSLDWVERPASNRLSEPGRSAREASPAYVREDSGVKWRSASEEVSLDGATPLEGAHGPTRVKSSLVLGAFEVLGDALERVLSRMERASAEPLRGIILPMGWVPLELYVELLRASERELGGSDGMLAVRIGRATGERELATMQRLVRQGSSPATAVEKIPQLFRAYHASGRAEVGRVTGGGYRVEVRGLTPDTLAHALAMSGFYPRLLEHVGAHDVRATVVSCKERGDDVTATMLRWR